MSQARPTPVKLSAGTCSGRAGPPAELLSRFALQESSRLEQRQGPRRGAGRGAGGQAQVGEDLDDHPGINDGGDDLQARAAARAVLDVDIEYAFKPSAPNSSARAPQGALPEGDDRKPHGR